MTVAKTWSSDFPTVSETLAVIKYCEPGSADFGTIQLELNPRVVTKGPADHVIGNVAKDPSGDLTV